MSKNEAAPRVERSAKETEYQGERSPSFTPIFSPIASRKRL
jgi:hypothetical protein